MTSSTLIIGFKNTVQTQNKILYNTANICTQTHTTAGYQVPDTRTPSQITDHNN